MRAFATLGKLGSLALKAVTAIKKAVAVLGMGFKLVSWAYAGIASLVQGSEQSMTRDIMTLISPDHGAYFASPRKEVGSPSWALSGTWPGMIGGQPSGGAAALLQTMPLAR